MDRSLLCLVCDTPLRSVNAETQTARIGDRASAKELNHADIERLYPFMRHTITDVRLSTLKAIHHYLPQQKPEIIPHLAQVLLYERDDRIRAACIRSWRAYIQQPGVLTQWFTPVNTFIQAVLTPFYEKLSYAADSSRVIGTHDIDQDMRNQDLMMVSLEEMICSREACITALAEAYAVVRD